MTNIGDSLPGAIRGIGGSFRPATADEVPQTEDFAGGRFPEAFRQMLVQFGPFTFEGEASVRADYGIFVVFGCTGDKYNIVNEMKLHPELHKKAFVPFATDAFGNYWLVDQRSGAVWFVEWFGKQETKRIADSFDEFLSLITVDSDA